MWHGFVTDSHAEIDCFRKARGLLVYRLTRERERVVNAGKRKVGINAGAVMCASAFFYAAALVLAQAPFYQGKTITVIAGQEPGGLGDLRLKSILPYFKKHIPGQPNIVTETCLAAVAERPPTTSIEPLVRTA